MSDEHTAEGSITEDVNEVLAAIEEIGTATQEGIESVEGFVEGGREGAGGSAASHGAAGGGLGGAAAGGLGALGGATAGLGGIAGAAGADPSVQRAIGLAGQVLSTVGSLVRPIEALVDGVREAIEGSHELRHVEYEFESAADPHAEWMVRQIEITDSLGAPYVATVELVIEDLDAQPRELLGRDCRLTMIRASLGADLCGVVHRVVHGRTTERAVVATVEIVPALHALGQRRDSRVFQDMTVVEILEEVLGNALEGFGREIDLGQLQRKYPAREHCVQYQETDLAFAHRLMEEEGITYYFEHHGNEKKEKMILADGEPYPAVLTFDSSPTIPFVAQRNEIRGTEPIHELASAEQLTSTSVVVADYDWTQGDVASFPVVSEQRGEDAQGRDREIYEHDRALTFSQYEKSGYGANDAKAQARVRHELAQRDALVARGSGVVTGFAPGRTFELDRHPRAELDGKYLITAVRHRGISAELRDLFGDASPRGASREYENTFECIPMTTKYRPERITPKPRPHGVLTAIVVGHDGQEIYSDDYGRVKVQFHWDRVGVRNQKSSCFVRVMQAWAGAGRGMQTYPRVGDEVVVDFVGGDVDRPLVIGSVYSAANPPPYRDKSDWTRTTIKSKTSPANGDRYNELRFDDLRDHEEIFLHASRDLNEVVEHDHTTRVKRNQALTVDGDQTETVRGDQTQRVEKDRRRHILGLEDIVIDNSRRHEVGTDEHLIVGSNRVREIGGVEKNTTIGKQTEVMKAGREVTVQEFDNLHVKANRNVTIDAQHNVEAGEHIALKVGTQSQLYMKNEIFAEAQDRLTLKCGDSQIELTPDKIKLGTSGELTIVVGAASVVVQSSGKVHIQGPAGARMVCAGTSVVLSPGGAEISSAKITSSAIGEHTIAGAIVKIN